MVVGWATALLALAGCGGDEPERVGRAEAERPEPADREERPKRVRPVERVPCPPELSNCAEASGRIVYVERVDPDGDGDAHFVLMSKDGITAPGIAVIDVGKHLRPRPLPEIGDQLAAAGPVYRGSYGQRQIEAIAINVRRTN
jgi:hypothetical protein